MSEGNNYNDITGTDSGIDIDAMSDITQSIEGDSSSEDSSVEIGNDNPDDVIGTLMDAQDSEEAPGGEPHDEEEEFEERDTKSEDGFEDDEVREEENVEQEPREVLKLKDGEKELEIPKDAMVEVKVSGKLESMTLQEALNKASGAVHIERETSRLGRERKEFEDTITNMNQTVAKLNEAADPFDFAATLAELQGKDPDEMYANLLQNVAKEVQRYQTMSPEQINAELHQKKLERKLSDYERKEATQRETQEKQASREEFHSSLTEQGIEVNEFEETLSDLALKAKNGEEMGFGLDSIDNPDENDIVDYILAKKLDDRVMSAVNSVNKDLGSQTEFINKVKKAVIQTEVLNGGKQLSPKEVSYVVQQAFELDNKALSESLSRKVNDSRKTNSKLVNSEEQEEGGYATLDEFLGGI